MFHREPQVDWDLWAAFRDAHSELLPALKDATVNRGEAENQLDLDPESLGLICSQDGRLLAAGGFGPFGILLSLAAGEQMAEMGLGLPLTVGE